MGWRVGYIAYPGKSPHIPLYFVPHNYPTFAFFDRTQK
jgi:hypothetical protein